jgi:hypothetical protein
VQNDLYWFLQRRGHSRTMPRFSPGGWWEADIYSITSAGYGQEYEIKLTRADFVQDAQKERRTTTKGVTLKKFEELLAGRGPRVFYYVVPETLLPELEIPEFAGVMTFRQRGKTLRFNEAKKPRLLHKNKVPDTVIAQLMQACYYRFWSERHKRLEK